MRTMQRSGAADVTGTRVVRQLRKLCINTITAFMPNAHDTTEIRGNLSGYGDRLERGRVKLR